MYGCYECNACGKEFGSERAMEQHMDAKGHWPVECDLCYDTFADKEDCQAHEYSCHNHCSDCSRTFQNYNNLRMHLNSSRHRGGSVTCPFCKKSLTTATGLAHHLEMNACPKTTTNRESIYRYVRSKDPNGTISKKLLEWDGDAKYEASDRTWNGWGYDCYLCTRDFKTVPALNQHLNSAAHQQSLYHCPSPGCRDFTTLAGIINHLESETCGVARFGDVQSSVTRMIGGGGLLCL